MSPLDDELRRALQSRAATLDPSPDPLAGIEQRARGMQRRRLALAGSALAVLAVAIAVPVALSGGSAQRPPQVVVGQPTPSGDPVVPSNVLTSWPSRGPLEEGPKYVDVQEQFAQAMGRPADGAEAYYRPLFTGSTDSGVRFTFGQAYFRGDTTAHTVGLSSGTTTGSEFFIGPITPADPHVLAWTITNLPGTVGELLVVVPEPRTTQVLYDTDAIGSFSPKDGAPGLDGVVLIDRAAGAADRLQLLTGNGDPATDVTFEGPVSGLLCGAKGCG